MGDHKHIVVYGEIVEGQMSMGTRELLGGARPLADALGEDVVLVCIGDGIEKAAGEGYAFGADRVYAINVPGDGSYEPGFYAAALAKIFDHEQPRYFIFGHTDQGSDLGPALAFRLDAAVATDCVELAVEEGTKRLVATKPVYGGLAMATLTMEGFPQVVTVRPKSLIPPDPTDKTGEVRSVKVDEGAANKVKSLEKYVEEAEGIKLEDADLIVCGGRGIGDAEGFTKDLAEAAKYLKGAVGASRVAVDSEWVPSTIQIGITGKIVAPKVYIAIGVSGASQHMSGCSRSKTIVAINKDARAAIFKYAKYGVVGDWKVVLPAMLDKLKSLD